MGTSRHTAPQIHRHAARTLTDLALGLARDRHGLAADETVLAVRDGVALAASASAGPGGVERLGGGWVAEEALAIAVYAALACSGPSQVRDALALAVTHSGDSDSTGAVCGNLLGAWHGVQAVPTDLDDQIEARPAITALAARLDHTR